MVRKRQRIRKSERRGTVVVLTAIMLVALFGMVAFAFDVGYIALVKTELQRSADAAAMAGAWELINDDELEGSENLNTTFTNVRNESVAYVAANTVSNVNPQIDFNGGNAAGGDLLIGHVANPSVSPLVMDYADPITFNAVQVTVRRNATWNDKVHLFFAPLIGVNDTELAATATAVMMDNFSGFRTPPDGSNLGILPFALDEDTWLGLLAGNGDDDWAWDADTKTYYSGTDGVLEVNLYPQGTGSPGNRGTVDVGPSNNSTADISRQITDGVTQADLDAIGGELKLNEYGELYLNGDTGISAGVKDELASIRGKPRVIPIFREVTGNGNNATYLIVDFVGIRIMDVKLTGQMSKKHVTIQPAHVVTKGAIPNMGSEQTSHYIYTPVRLLQ